MTGNYLIYVDSNRKAFRACQPPNSHLAVLLRSVNYRKILFRHEVNFILYVRVLTYTSLEGSAFNLPHELNWHPPVTAIPRFALQPGAGVRAPFGLNAVQVVVSLRN